MPTPEPPGRSSPPTARVVAVLDLKTDRAAGRVLIQAWHWLPEGRKREDRPLIEAEIGRFEAFQLGRAL